MSKGKAIYLKLPGDFKESVIWRDWGSGLEAYELKDVIEFEGYVSPHTDYAKSTTGQDVRIHGRCILLDDCFKPGDKLQVFVVKKDGK